MTYSDVEFEALMADLESDLAERKKSFGGDAPRGVGRAICAFANDLPAHRRPGVVFIGVRDPDVLARNDRMPEERPGATKMDGADPTPTVLGVLSPTGRRSSARAARTGREAGRPRVPDTAAGRYA